MASMKEQINTYLDGRKDKYNGLIVNSNAYKNILSINDLKNVLEYSETLWREKHYNCIWIKVNIEVNIL